MNVTGRNKHYNTHKVKSVETDSVNRDSLPPYFVEGGGFSLLLLIRQGG